MNTPKFQLAHLGSVGLEYGQLLDRATVERREWNLRLFLLQSQQTLLHSSFSKLLMVWVFCAIRSA